MHAPPLLISNLNAAWREPCSTHALSKGEKVAFVKPSNPFNSILSFLQRTLLFQTSEGVSHPICIPLMNSFGNEKDTYACAHRHVSRDTLENSDKKLAKHKNTSSLKINPTIGCLQFFPYLKNHLPVKQKPTVVFMSNESVSYLIRLLSEACKQGLYKNTNSEKSYQDKGG